MIVIPSSNEHAANPSVAFGAARTGEPSVAFLSRTNSPSDTGAARRAHERERSREAQNQADDRQHKRQALARRCGGSPPEGNSTMPPFERAGLVRLRAFFAGGIRIAGRLRGSHLLDGTLRLARTRLFALGTLDRLIPHGSHPSLQRARFPQAAPQKVAPPSKKRVILRKRVSPIYPTLHSSKPVA